MVFLAALTKSVKECTHELNETFIFNDVKVNLTLFLFCVSIHSDEISVLTFIVTH